MSNIKTIAVIHNDNDVKVMDAIVVTEMTHKECLAYINRMKREMDRMQMEYNRLLSIAETLERQRNRLLRDKYEMIEGELKHSYTNGLLNRLLGR